MNCFKVMDFTIAILKPLARRIETTIDIRLRTVQVVGALVGGFGVVEVTSSTKFLVIIISPFLTQGSSNQ